MTFIHSYENPLTYNGTSAYRFSLYFPGVRVKGFNQAINYIQYGNSKISLLGDTLQLRSYK